MVLRKWKGARKGEGGRGGRKKGEGGEGNCLLSGYLLVSALRRESCCPWLRHVLGSLKIEESVVPPFLSSLLSLYLPCSSLSGHSYFPIFFFLRYSYFPIFFFAFIPTFLSYLRSYLLPYLLYVHSVSFSLDVHSYFPIFSLRPFLLPYLSLVSSTQSLVLDSLRKEESKVPSSLSSSLYLQSSYLYVHTHSLSLSFAHLVHQVSLSFSTP